MCGRAIMPGPMPPAERLNRLALAVALAIIAPLLAMLAWSFGRGLDLTDEASYIYLYAHPRAVTPIMDHFVWGAMLRLVPWTIVDLRYLTLALLLSSTALLCAAAWRYLKSRAALPDPVLFFALPVLGALLYFSGLRPTLSYSTTLVVCSNLFFALLVWREDAGSRIARSAAIVLMGGMVAWCWLARFSVSLPLLVSAGLWFIACARARASAALLRTAAILAVALVLLGILWSAGCNIGGQIVLLKALTASSHSPLAVIAKDMAYGAVILAVALVLAVASGQLCLRVDARRSYRLLIVFIGIVAVIAVLAMVRHQDFVVLPPSSALYRNPPLRSLGPAIHVLALALLIFRAATLLAVKSPVLRHLFPAEPETARAVMVLRLTLLLYVASLVPEIGTNTGLWHRSVLSMGPLFLMLALLLPRGGEKWRTPMVLCFVAIPVVAVMASNMLTRPFRVAGSSFAQTETLDHPSALRGLKVTPGLAQTQVDLDKAFARLPSAASKAPVIYGYGMPGLAVLAGSPILGAPIYIVGYPNSEEWNCVLARFSAREQPPLIVGIDIAQLGMGLRQCLPGYSFGQPAAQAGRHVITLITPR